MQLATSDYTVPEAWSREGSEIKGGTPHLIALKFDPQAIRRIAAKVVYGLFKVVASRSLHPEHDHYLRQYILGLLDSMDEPVSIEPMMLSTTTSDKPHYIVLSPANDQNAAIVSLYGFKFRVELGPEAQLPAPIVMLCQIDGSGIRVANPDEITEIIGSASVSTFKQPWKQSLGPPPIT